LLAPELCPHKSPCSRFIDSEADLDGAIKALLPLAQAPVLAYPELVRSGTVALLVGLLAHENADIVIDVVEVVHELTDEDVGNEDEDEETEETAEEALKILIQGLVRPPFCHLYPKSIELEISWITRYWNCLSIICHA
jgi:hypothetical protein